MAEPARRLDDPYDPEDQDRAGDIRPSRPDSRSLSSVPTDGVRRGGSHLGKGKLKSVSDDDSKKLSPEKLAGAEAAGASAAAASESASKESGSIKSNDQTFGYRDESKHRGKGKSRGKFSLRNLTRKRGLLLTAGGVGGVGVVIMLSVLFFSSLLIPGLAQHIAEWQFARVTQQFSETASRVSDEALAVEAESGDKSVYDKMVQKFTSTTAGSKASALWSQLDDYRPSKVIEKLGANNGLKLNEATTSWGKTYLASVDLDGVEHQITKQGFTKYIPGLSSIVKFKNDVQFSQEFAPALTKSLQANNIGTIVRSATAKDIRQELGISLVAWIVGKYSGKDPTQARLQQAKDTDAAVNEGNEADNAVTDPVKQADQAAQAAEQQCVSKDRCLEQAINNGGVVQGVKDAVAKALGGSGLKDAAGLINPFYNVAMPVCIVYDGSLDRSGPTIDNQTAQQQRSFYYIESAADQQKYGSPKVDPEAVGAFNDDVNPDGQILQSNPEVRADGGTVDTSSIPSAEASADGEFTLLNATPGVSSFAGVINGLADTACPALTKLSTAIGVGLITLAASIFTGGTLDGAEEGAGTAATKVIQNIFNQVTTKFSERIAEEGLVKGTVKVGLGYYGRRFANLIWDLGKTSVKQASVLAAGTVLAKIIVMQRAAQVNSGLAQGNDLVNDGDCGGNIAAGEISRQGSYGRPLMIQEVDQSHEDDKAFVAYQNSQRSTYQRYLATDNADSLMSKVIGGIYSTVYSKTAFGSLFGSIGKVFNPSTLVNDIFGNFNSNMAYAVANTDTQDCGNVQFGWSDAEEQLIDSNQSYGMMENQVVLDQTNCDDNGCSNAPKGNGTADSYISGKYGKCFTESLGDLLSSGDVTRDENGNVIPNQGLCSPDNLGPNNPTLGDMVFRWRLAQSDSNALTQLAQEQSVSSATTTTTTPSTNTTGSNTNTASPTPTQACVVPVNYPPPPSGGMTYANWYFNQSSIDSIQAQVKIMNNPGTNSNEFLQLYDAGIDGSSQYFGLQTNGIAIFSRFGTTDTSNVRAGPGSTVTSGTNEGPFVSLRHNFGSLPAGNYSVRVVRTSSDGGGDWFSFYVTFPSQSETLIGSIRFPRKVSTAPATFNDGGGTWTEDFDNNNDTKLVPVPLWHVAVSIKANGNSPVTAVSSYSPMPNSDEFAEAPMGYVDMVLGGSTPRCHPAGALW